MYIGATGRPGNSAFTASYGLQLGNTFTKSLPVFTKHIVDLGYTGIIPIPAFNSNKDPHKFTGPLSTGAHRFLGLETRLTGGLIQSAAGAPLSERFLGGNEVRPFVQDPSWIIQSGISPAEKKEHSTRKSAASGSSCSILRNESSHAIAAAVE